MAELPTIQAADGAGETVLTDGHYTLIHDARVRLVDDVKAAGGRPD